jgi:DUF971 family protein
VRFDSGESYAIPAELLRVSSPSAEVQGHSPEQRKLVPGKEAVQIVQIEPVGNYAVKLHFDDRHDTGLFSWSYLRKLGREHDTLWAAYLDEMSAAGLSRSRS